jgi:hypothetical protein
MEGIMTNTSWAMVAILIVAALVLGALVAWLVLNTRRTRALRQQFGPEYQHTMDDLGDRRKAEAELASRRARVEAYHIRSLTREERDRYLGEWHSIQEAFVDSPAAAIDRADKLVTEVMRQRGYPMADFDQRAADLSVDHPQVVNTYRAARAVARRSQSGAADTEDLRKATIYYRDLVDDLLELPGTHSYTEVKR